MASRRPVALVTGAANGIGRALAEQLAQSGFSLLLIDLDQAGLEVTRAALHEPPGASHHVTTADVADPRAWREVVAHIDVPTHDVALLVQAAGVLAAGQLHTAQAEDLERVIRVNLAGALLGAHAVGPLLIECSKKSPPAPLPRGVLNLSSIFASVCPPGFAAYNASKAGLVALTETLRGEWAPHDLTATAVLPGVTRTGLFDRAAYADAATRAAVDARLSQSLLSAERVAAFAIQAHRSRAGVKPIGRRAAWYHALRSWAPEWTREIVARKAMRELASDA